MHGYCPSIIEGDHYRLGALGGRELVENGQWDRWLPSKEFQSKHGLETMNCTNYGTWNAIEMILDRKYGKSENFSERYSGVRTGTSLRGNDPHHVIETIRKYVGGVPERDLPFYASIDKWEEYYAPIEFSLKKKGAEWLKQWDVGHEWVVDGSSTQTHGPMMEDLKFSPLGVAVYAWEYDDGLYVKYPGQLANHWAVIYGYKEGAYWKCFDTYDRTLKKLEWRYPFDQVKRYSINYRQSLTLKERARIIKGTLFMP